MKKYKEVDSLPLGRADDTVTEGCLVLEGGAWRGLYTIGVLDELMANGINLRTTIGISAGALSALGYLAGQIGWAVRVDLMYRHDSAYCGRKAFRRDHGITGFTYLYRDITQELPLDKKRLMDPSRRMIVAATNMNTGELDYFEKGSCNLSLAVRASATVPLISRPVVMDGIPYLDGGCADKIPYRWAQQNQFEKIVVVKTREWAYRRKEKKNGRYAKALYKNYPNFLNAMEQTNRKFNEMAEEMLLDEQEGKIFVIAPSEKVEVSRFEGDLDKLAHLYWLGHKDVQDRLEQLMEYLGKEGQKNENRQE